MNRFWTREARLAKRLKAERPEPSRLFMGSMMERLEAHEAPRARRSAGLRVGLASAVSLAFLTGLAAFGGLGQAATSIAHVGRTASHVVIPQHQTPVVPAQQVRSSSNSNESSSRGVSSADDQYNNEIVCILIFPGTKYAHILKLPRFLVPLFQRIHPGAVVVTCPTRRGHG